MSASNGIPLTESCDRGLQARKSWGVGQKVRGLKKLRGRKSCTHTNLKRKVFNHHAYIQAGRCEVPCNGLVPEFV